MTYTLLLYSIGKFYHLNFNSQFYSLFLIFIYLLSTLYSTIHSQQQLINKQLHIQTLHTSTQSGYHPGTPKHPKTRGEGA